MALSGVAHGQRAANRVLTSLKATAAITSEHYSQVQQVNGHMPFIDKYLQQTLLVAAIALTSGASDASVIAATPELAASGVIRKITIISNPIFNPNTPGERKRLFRLANALHIQTQERTIRAQLLFAEGERYSERALRETERNLRQLRFLREPIIRVTAIDGDQVDIEVQTTDVWSFSPTLSVGRSGGSNRSAFGIEEIGRAHV